METDDFAEILKALGKLANSIPEMSEQKRAELRQQAINLRYELTGQGWSRSKVKSRKCSMRE